MNQEPMLTNVEAPRHLGRRLAAIVAAGSMLFAACSDDDNETKKFVVSESEFAEFCNNAPFATNAYEAQVGIGPFASNEAADAEAPKDADIKLEAAEELGQGNAMGVSLLRAARNQQNSTYNPSTLLTEAGEIFEDTYDNPEKFQEECKVVVEALLTEGEGEVGLLTSEEVAEFTNAYTDGVLTSLSRVDNADTQGQIPILGFRDKNGALVAGISLDPNRDGRFVMALQDNDETAQITPDSAPDTTVVNPEVDENGNPIPAEPTEDSLPEITVPAEGPGEGPGPNDGEPNDNGCDSGENEDCEGGEEPGEPTPTPTTAGPTPTTTGPAPTTSQPAPTTTQPAPTTSQPAPTTTQPAPTTTQPAPTTTIVDVCPNIPGVQGTVPAGQEIVYINGQPFCKDIQPTTVTTGNPAP